MPAITVRNLGKRYRAFASPWQRMGEMLLPGFRGRAREFVALEGINLEVERGCALGVVGPNGAGKSTLLRILAGIVEPSDGEARTEGSVASILELGTGFHPEFTGRENVFINAAIMGHTPEQARAAYEDIARFCELGHYLDMPVKTYSSGMFVRLAFAVAISAQPDILLVDEALAVGDAVFAHRCLARIREMRERGVTIVFVSHDTNAIVNVCDRAIFLDRGRLAAEGPPKDVIHLYLLNVAERLTTLKEKSDIATAFHEIGAVENTAEAQEKRFGSFQARITDIFVERPDGAPAARVRSGEEVVLRAIVRFDQPVRDPVFGVMIRNRFGVEIFGTNTHLKRIATGSYSHNDTLEVRFRVRALIAPGVYALSFAVHTADGHFFDYRVDARVLEIVGPVDTIGVANLPAEIVFRPVPRDAASPDDIFEAIYGNAPATLSMGEDSETFVQGDWYAPQEMDGRAYRWMGRQGLAFVRVPAGCSRLRISLRTFDPQTEHDPMRVECFCEDKKAAEFSVTHCDWMEADVAVPVAERARTIPLRLVASRCWVPRDFDPSSTDTRELSILVAQISAQ
jgi:lipopolysaccharide transport system ATP-binding protein